MWGDTAWVRLPASFLRECMYEGGIVYARAFAYVTYTHVHIVLIYFLDQSHSPGLHSQDFDLSQRTVLKTSIDSPPSALVTLCSLPNHGIQPHRPKEPYNLIILLEELKLL